MPGGRCVRGRRAREPAQGAGVPGHRRRGAGATRSRQLCAWDRCGCPPPVPRAQEQHARRPGRAAGRGDGQGDGGGLADEATGRAAAGMPRPGLRTGRRVVGLPEGRADGSCAPGTDAAAHHRSQAHKSNTRGDRGGLPDEATGRATGAGLRMRRRAGLPQGCRGRASGRGAGSSACRRGAQTAVVRLEPMRPPTSGPRRTRATRRATGAGWRTRRRGGRPGRTRRRGRTAG